MGGEVGKVSALQKEAGAEQGVMYLHGFQLPNGYPSGERPVPGFLCHVVPRYSVLIGERIVGLYNGISL